MTAKKRKRGLVCDFTRGRTSEIYVLTGNPIALARPRMSHNRVWDKQKELKLINGINLKHQHGSAAMFDGPLLMEIVFFMPLPESRKLQERYLDQYYHACKPDLSNLLKFVEDIGTGIIYPDDRCIAEVHCKKIYDKYPHTEFTVTEIEYER